MEQKDNSGAIFKNDYKKNGAAARLQRQSYDRWQKKRISSMAKRI